MDRVRKVVILGGGTSGWMTAAALAATFGKTISISLVESDAIGSIGVGEATIPTIHWFNNLIQLDEAAFLRSTKASYKLGIEFVGWTGEKSRYFHPFGRYGVDIGTVPFHQRWLRGQADGSDQPLDAYSLATQLAKAGRFAKPTADNRSILATLGYAFHFDASLYAAHLRRIAEGAGVRRYEGKLASVEQDSQTGFVTALSTDRDVRLEADLFIDCSGFKALLIDGVMESPFEDWSHWLPCNSAVAIPCAAGSRTEPFTRATLRSAGWQWRIPLQHRIGNGYVYSNAFLSDDEAAATLGESLDGAPLGEARLIKFKTGLRPKAWRKNVVAIGLSAGFLEPLESTSIHLIQSGIAKLLSLFPNKDCHRNLRNRYNYLMNADMDGIRDFLILHYQKTEGNDQPFWQHVRNRFIPESLDVRIDEYRRAGRLMLNSDDLFKEASWVAVLNGQGVRALGTTPIADTLDTASNIRQLNHISDVVAAAVPTFRTHDDYISAVLAETRKE